MQWIILAIIGLILCFGFVVFFGAPYVPTLSPQARIALKMIDLKPGQTLLELGSGDGKMLKMAAAAGLNAVGFEINPILVIISRVRTWRYRKRVKIVWGDLWNSKTWPPADAIFVFILQKHMEKLDKKIMQWHVGKSKSLKLVSFAFTVPGKEPVKAEKGIFLYEYK